MCAHYWLNAGQVAVRRSRRSHSGHASGQALRPGHTDALSGPPSRRLPGRTAARRRGGGSPARVWPRRGSRRPAGVPRAGPGPRPGAMQVVRRGLRPGPDDPRDGAGDDRLGRSALQLQWSARRGRSGDSARGRSRALGVADQSRGRVGPSAAGSLGRADGHAAPRAHSAQCADARLRGAHPTAVRDHGNDRAGRRARQSTRQGQVFEGATGTVASYRQPPYFFPHLRVALVRFFRS
ncbi:unnamed protein product [Trichogramma brassicae]|uniref:Uncharacterized protein n=1 Tax=Trichogramma brassicae TaxID=86971 RepID=A0A6H5IC19_9HYME|nr:unnamed protein product [Trichogramma brassicae]